MNQRATSASTRRKRASSEKALETVVPATMVAPQAQQSTCRITRASKGKGVRVGALAWQLEDDEEGSLSEFEFVETLRAVAAKGKRPDLILCAGMAVWTRRPRRKGFQPEKDFAKAVCEVAPSPVLFESYDGSWRLAHQDNFTTIRLGQRVVSADEAAESGFLVVSELGSGYGVVDVHSAGHQVRRLVLLICGEASILKKPTTQSLVAGGCVGGLSAPPALKDSWVLLHPSHRPYGNHTKNDGFAMVGKWNDGKVEREPWLQEFVDYGAGFSDQTRAPDAVIHAGTYRDWKSVRGADIDYAALCFEPGLAAPTTGKPFDHEHPLAFRYSEFVV